MRTGVPRIGEGTWLARVWGEMARGYIRPALLSIHFQPWSLTIPPLVSEASSAAASQ